jgi:predicted lipoprotein with Yx(FWY)xxD motif
MTHGSLKRAIRAIALAAGVTLALGVTGLASAPAGAATSKKSAVRTATVPGMGIILVDAHGHALYTHTDANGDAVACTDQCAGIWSALTVGSHAKVKAPKGVKALATTSETHQVTSAGLPLYTFTQDTQAKQANGEGLNGFGGTWHVVTVKATKAKAKSDTPTTNAGTGGVSF